MNSTDSISEPECSRLPDWLPHALKESRRLTKMQSEVLSHLAAGMDIRSTARLMNRSERTIKAHTTAILNRLSLGSRLQAGIVAYHLVTQGALTLPQPENGPTDRLTD